MGKERIFRLTAEEDEDAIGLYFPLDSSEALSMNGDKSLLNQLGYKQQLGRHLSYVSHTFLSLKRKSFQHGFHFTVTSFT